MYTVARFNAQPDARDALDSFVAAVNRREGDQFLTPRARGGGFSCSLSSSDSWDEHREAIAGFLADHGLGVRAFVDAGGVSEFDTALDSADVYGERLYTDFFLTPDLIASLASAGSYAGFTFYPGPDTPYP